MKVLCLEKLFEFILTLCHVKIGNISFWASCNVKFL